MDAVEAVRRVGGVARVDTLRRLGVSAHRLRQAKEYGRVITPRRGWVAATDADPMLIRAARGGIVLSCITVAARRGLWVHDASATHVAAPPRAGHVAASGCVIHWRTPVFPRTPDACEDSLENALVMIAGCQPHESALSTWESAVRQGAVDLDVIRRAPLPASARRVLDEVTPFADAGTETIFRTRLRWLGVPVRPQIWLHGHRVDFLIGERLVVQIDGGHHVGAQRTSDIAHDAVLKLHGYHVIRIGYEQLMHHWEQVQGTIMTALAQGLHRAA